MSESYCRSRATAVRKITLDACQQQLRCAFLEPPHQARGLMQHRHKHDCQSQREESKNCSRKCIGGSRSRLGLHLRTHVRLLLAPRSSGDCGTETSAVDIVLSGNRDVSFGPMAYPEVSYPHGLGHAHQSPSGCRFTTRVLLLIMKRPGSFSAIVALRTRRGPARASDITGQSFLHSPSMGSGGSCDTTGRQ